MNLEPIEELVRFVPRGVDALDLTRDLLAMPNSPDAVLSSNGLLATGVYRAISQSGKRFPDEVAFATFDDTPWSSMVSPAVTVIQQPTHDIGSTAIELLLSRMSNPTRPMRTVVLSHKLIARRSCGCVG